MLLCGDKNCASLRTQKRPPTPQVYLTFSFAPSVLHLLYGCFSCWTFFLDCFLDERQHSDVTLQICDKRCLRVKHFTIDWECDLLMLKTFATKPNLYMTYIYCSMLGEQTGWKSSVQTALPIPYPCFLFLQNLWSDSLTLQEVKFAIAHTWWI